MKKFSDYVNEGYTPDPENIERNFKKEYEKYAKETLKVEYNKGAVYAFGSELATLRLYKVYYNGKSKISAGYSQNRKSFYFMQELNFV